MSRIKRLVPVVLAFALLSALVPAQAFAYGANALMASSANIASGTWGTCPWEIRPDGTLTVHPGRGKDVGMYSDSPWIGYAKSIKHIVFSEEDGQKVIAPEDCGKLLAVSWPSYDDDHMHWNSGGFGASFYASNVESIDLSGLDTSHVESMYCMFSGCSSLTALDVSTLNTSHVTNMHFMFNDCIRLKALDLSNFDTRNVETMNAMFYECYALQSVDVSTFDTSKVTDMEFMFSDCESLESIDISWFDMSSVTSTESMFQGCQSLKAIDLSGLDFSNVTNMSYMFSAVAGVTKLDLTGFGSAVVDMEHAFASCSSLRELQLGPDLLLKENCGLREGSWRNQESGKTLSTAGLIAASSQGKSGGVWQYVKKANTMAAYVKKWAFSVKAKKLKKKAQKVSKPIDVYHEEGSVSFKNVSTTKKAKKFKVNAKTGTVTVPKKTKKGTYKIKVKVTATGDNDYKSASKKVTVKIKVK